MKKLHARAENLSRPSIYSLDFYSSTKNFLCVKFHVKNFNFIRKKILTQGWPRNGPLKAKYRTSRKYAQYNRKFWLRIKKKPLI